MFVGLNLQYEYFEAVQVIFLLTDAADEYLTNLLHVELHDWDRTNRNCLAVVQNAMSVMLDGHALVLVATGASLRAVHIPIQHDCYNS